LNHRYDHDSSVGAPRRRPRTTAWDDERDDGFEPFRGPGTDRSERPDRSVVAPSAPVTDADEPAWSTWLGAVHGPEPFPAWVVTDLGAVDTELGVLTTGKEADVHLVERAVPGQPGCLLAAKRYRSGHHRLFHRDAGYLEGRRVRRSRENRAMATRTDFGRELIAGQWAAAEFAALGRLVELRRRGGDVRAPYPVQLRGTELMLEFIGEPDGTAAPRLAQLRPDGDGLPALWEQVVGALRALAAAGLAHGDLSPYNLLVHHGELVLIDLPQVVDVVGNPQGPAFLARDVSIMCAWFEARGLPAQVADPVALTSDLLTEAGLH
jgi:RIO kinase 1